MLKALLTAIFVLAAASTASATICQDTMTGSTGTNLTAHTTDSGHSWSKQSGTTGNQVLTDANRMRSTADVSVTYLCSADHASADYDVQLLVVASPTPQNYISVVGRAASGDQSKYLCTYDPLNTRWGISKHDAAGASTDIGSFYTDTVGALAQRTVKLQMRGSSIKCFIDDVERMSATDTTITAKGFAGIFTYGNNNDTTGYHGDNFITIETVNSFSFPALLLMNSN